MCSEIKMISIPVPPPPPLHAPPKNNQNLLSFYIKKMGKSSGDEEKDII